VGMHTFDDAAVYVRGRAIRDGQFSITDMMPTLLDLMDIPAPEDIDGRSLLK
jgi:arylsulfatase A-like enzyme